MGFFPAQAEDDQLDTSDSPAVMVTLYNDAIHQELCVIKDAAQLVLLFLLNCFSCAVNLVLSVANYVCCSQQINVQHLAIGALLNREVEPVAVLWHAETQKVECFSGAAVGAFIFEQGSGFVNISFSILWPIIEQINSLKTYTLGGLETVNCSLVWVCKWV